MAFTVTGGKHALQTLTDAGINTVTVNTAVHKITRRAE
jgi:hypothetical protein